MDNIVLENEVVRLRPVELTDIDAMTIAANDVRIWGHMSFTLRDRAAVENYVQKAIQERKQGISYLFVVIDKQTNTLVGCTSFLDISIPHQRLEIGATWYNPSVWRTAINTNCKFLLLQHCFESMQLNRVQIKAGHENLRSQQAIERIGAQKEGILRNHMIKKDGTIRHTVMYSIVIEDWQQVKAKFVDQLL